MFKLITLFAALASSQLSIASNFSAWSDKTVCRLRKEQPANTGYIAEEQTRGLDCIAANKPPRKRFQVDEGWCEAPYMPSIHPQPDYDQSFDFKNNFYIASEFTLPEYRYAGYGLDPIGHQGMGNISPEIKVVADLNNDQIDDLWIEFYESEVPSIVLYGTANGQFQRRHQMPIESARRHIRNGEVADINNDGWLDLLGFTTGDPGFRFRAEGYDIGNRHIPRGQADVVLINQQGQGFTHLKVPEIRRNDWNHGGSAGDINGDGLIDILPLSEGEKEHTVPLINQGNTKFKLNTTAYSSEISRLLTSDLDAADLNGDGIDDIAVIVRPLKDYSHTALARTQTIRVIYGDRDNNMTNNKQIKFGKSWVTDANYAEYARLGAGDTVQAGARASGVSNKDITVGNSNVEIVDINGDGRPDILEGFYLTNTGLWQTSGFMAYINMGDCFVDGTDYHFPAQHTNRRFHEDKDYHTNYIHNFHLADVSNDGHQDLLLQVDGQSYWAQENPTHFPYLFINNGQNVYLPAQTAKVQSITHDQDDLVAGDFNGDGLIDVVSILGDWKSIPRVRLYAQKSYPDQPDALMPPAEFSSLSTNMKSRIKGLLKDNNIDDKVLDTVLTLPFNPTDSIEDGEYTLQWYMLNMGDTRGYEKVAKDDLSIKGGKASLIIGDRYKQPSANLREKLGIDIDASGLFRLSGELDLFNPSRAYPTEIMGKLQLGVGLGIWNDGDPIVVILKKH